LEPEKRGSRICRQYQAYSAELLAGHLYLDQKSFRSARIRFDRALAYLQKASFREVMRPEIAEVISEAEKHYRQWGLRHQAEIISTSPWLRFLWAEE